MTYLTKIEIVAAFEREINKLDDAINKPATEDSLYWLNQATAKFCKLRFNGNLPHLTSYELNEKRTQDLVTLLVNDYTMPFVEKIEHNNYDEYVYTYPENCMYLLSEDVEIAHAHTTDNGIDKLDVSVFECTADSFMYRIMNSLTDFHYHHKRARPLRIRKMVNGKRGCSLLTDKTYTISKYNLAYLKYPAEITLESEKDARTEYKSFPDNIMFEIIKMAALMYIENQSDKRYQTLTNEVNTQE